MDEQAILMCFTVLGKKLVESDKALSEEIQHGWDIAMEKSDLEKKLEKALERVGKLAAENENLRSANIALNNKLLDYELGSK